MLYLFPDILFSNKHPSPQNITGQAASNPLQKSGEIKSAGLRVYWRVNPLQDPRINVLMSAIMPCCPQRESKQLYVDILCSSWEAFPRLAWANSLPGILWQKVIPPHGRWCGLYKCLKGVWNEVSDAYNVPGVWSFLILHNALFVSLDSGFLSLSQNAPGTHVVRNLTV